MNEQVHEALKQGGVIDITTRGRRSGEPRRIEIRFHNVDGTVYITGTPGRRGWYANLLADPAFTFHLKGGPVADLAARATPITDPAQRRSVLTRILQNVGRSHELGDRLARSPLVRVTLDR